MREWTRIRILLMFALPLAACSSDNASDFFEVQCHCSIVHLLSDSQRYQGQRVRVIGVLVPVEHATGVGRLYLSYDDARFVNDANSVFIDTRNSSNTDLPSLHDLTGKFVVADGRFSTFGAALTIDYVHNIRPLAPLPLDNSRFDPGITESGIGTD